MKALSIQQPWAWLIIKGYKPIENRRWHTQERGQILIHAGKKFDAVGYRWIRIHFPEIPLPKPEEFKRGGILGEVTLTDCVTQHSSPWFFGPFGFVFENQEETEFIPCKGQLKFFNV